MQKNAALRTRNAAVRKMKLPRTPIVIGIIVSVVITLCWAHGFLQRSLSVIESQATTPTSLTQPVKPNAGESYYSARLRAFRKTTEKAR